MSRALIAALVISSLLITISGQAQGISEGAREGQGQEGTLLYSSFLGGGNSDVVRDMFVDEDGNIYLTGDTYSEDFPTTEGAFDTSFNGIRDIYVAKFDPRGTTLLFSTFVGGADNDIPEGLTVDGEGNVFVAGRSESADFPTTSGAYNEQSNGDSDVVLFKLAADGGDLVYSTFVGGSDYEVGAAGVTLDGQGNAYVAGHTKSSDFPTTDGAYDRSYYCCGWDGFVFKMNPAGSDLVYSTYFGGWDYEGARAIGVDGQGQAYLTGDTTSNDFETTSGAYDETYNGERDVFALVLTAAGSDLVYSTFLGGTDDEIPNNLDLLNDNSLWLAGYTKSQDLPTTSDAYDGQLHGERSFFVSRLNEDGSDLEYSSYIGGSQQDEVDGLEAQGKVVHLSGRTYSEDFPVTDDAFQGTNNGGMDGILLTLDTNREGEAQLVYSSYYGGEQNERLWDLQVVDDEYISVGLTASEDLPVTEGAYDTSFNGGPVDGLFMKAGANSDWTTPSGDPGSNTQPKGDDDDDEGLSPVLWLIGVFAIIGGAGLMRWYWTRSERSHPDWQEIDH